MEGGDDFNAGETVATSRTKPAGGRVLVVDDSTMLLNFVKEMLLDAHYEVATATTGAAGLAAAKTERPALILLDYVLPDMRGDETIRRLMADPDTANIPVVYMSGMGSDLRPDAPNVIGFLNKPFTSDLLIKTVETHMPEPGDAPTHEPAETPPPDYAPVPENEPVYDAPEATPFGDVPAEVPPDMPADLPEPPQSTEWWSEPQPQSGWADAPPAAEETGGSSTFDGGATVAEPVVESDLPNESVTGG